MHQFLVEMKCTPGKRLREALLVPNGVDSEWGNYGSLGIVFTYKEVADMELQK